MILDSMPFRDKPEYGTAHAQIEESQIAYGGDCQDPDAIGDISQSMDDKRSQKETDCESGNGREPIGQNAPGNVPRTQLQARPLLRRFQAVVKSIIDIKDFQKPLCRCGATELLYGRMVASCGALLN